MSKLMHSEEITELLEHLGIHNCVKAEFIFEVNKLAFLVATIEVPSEAGVEFINKIKKYRLKEISNKE